MKEIEFDKVIEQLYFSRDKYIQLLITNVAVHRGGVNFDLGDETVLGVHTGYYFKTQRGTLMELVYCPQTYQLVYQKVMDNNKRKLGEVMRWCFTQCNGDDYMRFVPYIVSMGDYDVSYRCFSYDIDEKTFERPSEFPAGRLNSDLFVLISTGSSKKIPFQFEIKSFRL